MAKKNETAIADLEIKFTEPPPPPPPPERKPKPLTIFLDALRARPGAWAIVPDGIHKGTLHSVIMGARHVRVHFEIRKVGPVLYMRFVGETRPTSDGVEPAPVQTSEAES